MPVAVGIGQEIAYGLRMQDAAVEKRVDILDAHHLHPQPLGPAVVGQGQGGRIELSWHDDDLVGLSGRRQQIQGRFVAVKGRGAADRDIPDGEVGLARSRRIGEQKAPGHAVRIDLRAADDDWVPKKAQVVQEQILTTKAGQGVHRIAAMGRHKAQLIVLGDGLPLIGDLYPIYVDFLRPYIGQQCKSHIVCTVQQEGRSDWCGQHQPNHSIPIRVASRHSVYA